MEKLAIVGTGIAGMGAAWLLKEKYDITFYEKNNYPGGHTNTVTVDENGKPVFIDTGFMVFNKVTYPNLVKLFDILQVPIKQTSMSFSVQHLPSGLEYCGSGLNGLFAQRKNLFNPGFISMLFEINRFNSEALELLAGDADRGLTLGSYIRQKGYHSEILEKYLLPMSSAVWSTPPNKMLEFPAATLVQFFYNHGFLGLNTQHQWYTIVNGSQAYRSKLLGSFAHNLKLKKGIVRIERIPEGVELITNDGQRETFDKVIIASHADEALAMLDMPTVLEQRLLTPFKYQHNTATLHTDTAVMPRAKRAWSSWNYRIAKSNNDVFASVIYYMNSLQQVSDTKDYFVSIDDPGAVREEHVLRKIDYTHPLFNSKTAAVQPELYKLNMQNNNTYFCGSYFKYGFHEDAFTSAVSLAKILDPGLVW
ncbi:MAG: NAD(P)-binding protein [Ignavibacteria bacterium]|nr:NAD(P)-binding protein [Ignavibacteria bacterium]